MHISHAPEHKTLVSWKVLHRKGTRRKPMCSVNDLLNQSPTQHGLQSHRLVSDECLNPFLESNYVWFCGQTVSVGTQSTLPMHCDRATGEQVCRLGARKPTRDTDLNFMIFYDRKFIKYSHYKVFF